MLRTNFMGIKIRDEQNKYTKFGQLIIRKIIKIIATRCHISRLKFTKLDFWSLFICLFVRLFVCAFIPLSVRLYIRVLDGVWRQKFSIWYFKKWGIAEERDNDKEWKWICIVA